MTAFYIIAGGMTLLALGFIAWPLSRNQHKLQNHRRAANRVIYQQRLEVIQGELESGRLSTEQATALREDAGRHLLGDLESAGAQPEQLVSRSRTWPVLLLVVLVLPAIAIGTYLRSDSWLLIQHEEGEPAWGYLFRKLDDRLALEPEDTEALLMLARTRRAVQDLPASLKAYERLNRVTGYSNAEYLTDEAETRILMEEGGISAQSSERLQQALKLQPDYGRALWYAGLASMAEGDQAAATGYWLRLDKQDLPQAFRKVLQQQLLALGVPQDNLLRSAPAASQPTIDLHISADNALTEGLSGDTPVFVMAKPASGGRAMLAVRKHRLSELPLRTQLTDGMNMAGGPQLSSTDSWRVTVRVAQSGGALPQAGDPFTDIVLTTRDLNGPARLLINKRWDPQSK